MDYKKYFKLILRFAISGGLIVFLIWKYDFTEIAENLSGYDLLRVFGFFILSVLVSLTGLLFSSKRWKTIINIVGHDQSHKSLYILYLKGYFYNLFMPTQMGGDLYKSIMLGRKINDQSTSFFTVFVDRFGGLVVLLLLSLFGIASTQGLKGVLISLAVVVVAFALYFPILNITSKKIKFLIKFKEASDLFVKNVKGAWSILLLSLIVQIISFTSVYLLFIGFGQILSLKAVITFMPLTSLALLLPSFNGIGTQDTIYPALYTVLGGVPLEISIAVSALIHLSRFIISIIGGVLILLGKE